jgi:hypothetical protein
MLNDGSTTTTCSTLLPGRFKLQTGPRFVWSSSKVFMLRPVVEDHSLAWWKLMASRREARAEMRKGC